MDINDLRRSGFAIVSKSSKNSKEIMDYLEKEGFQNKHLLTGEGAEGSSYWVAPDSNVIRYAADDNVPYYTLQTFKKITSTTNRYLSLWI
jgi:predicted mannosyl-3-phosphoglycerate phosphatase (HAD superfamily)